MPCSILVHYLIVDLRCAIITNSGPMMHERARFRVRQGGGGVVVYQYTWKKFAKIPKIHPNIPTDPEDSYQSLLKYWSLFFIPPETNMFVSFTKRKNIENFLFQVETLLMITDIKIWLNLCFSFFSVYLLSCFRVSKRLGNGANEERIIISLLRKMDSAGGELKKNWNEPTNQRKKERKKRGKERRERTWNNDFFRPE